jgi:hypothetical protein
MAKEYEIGNSRWVITSEHKPRVMVKCEACKKKQPLAQALNTWLVPCVRCGGEIARYV